MPVMQVMNTIAVQNTGIGGEILLPKLVVKSLALEAVDLVPGMIATDKIAQMFNAAMDEAGLANVTVFVRMLVIELAKDKSPFARQFEKELSGITVFGKYVLPKGD